MAVVTRRGVLPLLVFCLGALMPAVPARAALLEPLDGRGNFHSYIDVVNRWRDEDSLDVLVLVSVANGDLVANQEESGRVARLRLEVTLTGPDGKQVTRTRPVRSAGISEADAGSRTLRQVFGVVLKDVPFRSGRIDCAVYDVNRRRSGLLYQLDRQNARSEASVDWFAEEGPRAASGLALDDPLFLVQAPLTAWKPESAANVDETGGFVGDYVHPARLYGLEQDRLQMVLPVWPQPGGITREADLSGLRLQVVDAAGVFSLTDTLHFDARGRAALETGRPAYMFYELDVNPLPEGAYRLSIAPLGAQGRGLVSGFTVAWRLGTLARHHDLVAGEGFTVFEGQRREEFLAASPIERESMLDEFWERLNPEPGSPVNAVRLEFQARLAYVQQYLGGFGPQGARDGRGEIYLLLGPPDETEREPVPLNHRDQDDARVKVYDRLALDRPGSTAKGASPGGTSPSSPYETLGGVAIAGASSAPAAVQAERDRVSMVYKAGHDHAFELWNYDNGGKPLFANRLTNKGMGQRFLFVDRTGSGEYHIESSNVIQGDN